MWVSATTRPTGAAHTVDGANPPDEDDAPRRGWRARTHGDARSTVWTGPPHVTADAVHGVGGGSLPRMRAHLRCVYVAALSLVAACSDPAPAASDATVVRDVAADVATDAAPDVGTVDTPTTSACPAALGAPTPRPPMPPRGPMDDVLHLNHLQAMGTHNSYHLRPALAVPEWNYSHAPLDVQFESQGVRAIELDIHWISECERYRVMHVPNLDNRSTCDWFTDCLTVVRRWSDAHAAHHPIFIHIEPKNAFADGDVEARMTAMEREILSVFPRDMVITPDEVRGSSPTLAEAIRARGWPTLGATRGRVLFYIDRTDNVRTVYTHGGRDLAGRLAFIDSAMSDPFAGVLVLNNARSPDVPAGVRAGFVVRVFSWGVGEAGDDALAQAALDSGAQIVSTDYPAVVPGITRAVEIPGGTPSRCNPLIAPAGCTSRAIEDLPR